MNETVQEIQDHLDRMSNPPENRLMVVLRGDYYNAQKVADALKDIQMRMHLDALTKADELLLTIIIHDMYIPY